MAVNRMHIDPEIGIPDLVHRLSDDSKRLMLDEVRLAKLEVNDDLRRGGKGLMWAAIAFGIGVVAMVFFTLTVVTLIGRLVAGHMWVGALAVGVLELIVAVVLVKRGIAAYAKPSYSLEQTRESLKDTRAWVRR